MTALTPAQVRDHARALILEHQRDTEHLSIVEYVSGHPDFAELDDDGFDAIHERLDDAIRTARITVDWDEDR